MSSRLRSLVSSFHVLYCTLSLDASETKHLLDFHPKEDFPEGKIRF